MAKLSQKIANEIDRGKYDVVFVHTCQHTFIPILLQYLRTPSIYYVHEPFGRQFVRNIRRPYFAQISVRRFLDRFDPLIGLYYGYLYKNQRKSIAGTDMLLANSQFTRDEMKRAHKIAIPVCHNGVDIDTFRPMPGIKKEDFVLSVGEMSPRKGFDFIVEAIGRIPKNNRPPLRLACNRIDLHELEYIVQLARHMDVDLVVLRNLNTDQLRDQYNAARICVYAPVLEPFGLVPLEAMACGTTVVGVAEGGVQESIKHEKTGLLVDRDPIQFASAVQRLMDDSALCEHFGQQAREYVLDQWAWDQAVQRLEQFLHQVAQGDTGQRSTRTSITA